VAQRNARKGRNPGTGEEIKIKAKKVSPVCSRESLEGRCRLISI